MHGAMMKRDALDDKLRRERARGHLSVGLGAVPGEAGERELALVVIYNEGTKEVGPFPDTFEGLKVLPKPAPGITRFGGRR